MWLMFSKPVCVCVCVCVLRVAAGACIAACHRPRQQHKQQEATRHQAALRAARNAPPLITHTHTHAHTRSHTHTHTHAPVSIQPRKHCSSCATSLRVRGRQRHTGMCVWVCACRAERVECMRAASSWRSQVMLAGAGGAHIHIHTHTRTQTHTHTDTKTHPQGRECTHTDARAQAACAPLQLGGERVVVEALVCGRHGPLLCCAGASARLPLCRARSTAPSGAPGAQRRRRASAAAAAAALADTRARRPGTRPLATQPVWCWQLPAWCHCLELLRLSGWRWRNKQGLFASIVHTFAPRCCQQAQQVLCALACVRCEAQSK
jgi:hypothetical protein